MVFSDQITICYEALLSYETSKLLSNLIVAWDKLVGTGQRHWIIRHTVGVDYFTITCSLL
jgi:hypothetical protein